MIKIIRGTLNKIDRAETLRYLGYPTEARRGQDTEADAFILGCIKETEKALDLRACYDLFPIERSGDSLNLGFATTCSRSLRRNLEGCGRVVLFACTAGVEVDRLIAKYKRISPSKAAVVQAAGAAAAEGWCDEICRIIREEYGETRPRFSCGYGDLPLTLQRDIFAALSVTKSIGVTLSDDLFMTPSKSVTALVGIKGD